MKQSKNQQKNSSGVNGSTNGQNNGNSGQPAPLEKFFIDALKDIYYAEQLLMKTLPEMQKAATTEELEEAFENHTRQTERHIKRLEKIFKMLNKNPEGKKCEAMEGLVKEAKTVISETKEGTMTRDVGLIISAQKVEHYEIASYGGLVQLAITMGLDQAAGLLDKTLNEEEETDYLLTEIAEANVNVEAEDEGQYSWEKQEQEEEA